MKPPPITEGEWTYGGYDTVWANNWNMVCKCRANAVVNGPAIAALPELLAALERALSVIEDLPYPENHPAKQIKDALLKAGFTE